MMLRVDRKIDVQGPLEGSLFGGPFYNVPYCVGTLKRDPNLETLVNPKPP